MSNDDADTMFRDKAIERVDRRHGYTAEFAPHFGAHVQEYDDEEALLRAKAGEDPGLILCGHEPRHHYMGGGLRVCFECLVRTFGRVP